MYINGYFKVVDGQTSGEENEGERGGKENEKVVANGTKVESEEEKTEGGEYEGGRVKEA